MLKMIWPKPVTLPNPETSAVSSDAPLTIGRILICIVPFYIFKLVRVQ